MPSDTTGYGSRVGMVGELPLPLDGWQHRSLTALFRGRRDVGEIARIRLRACISHDLTSTWCMSCFPQLLRRPFAGRAFERARRRQI